MFPCEAIDHASIEPIGPRAFYVLPAKPFIRPIEVRGGEALKWFEGGALKGMRRVRSGRKKKMDQKGRLEC